ncbi:MAG: ParA family protein [Acetobacteraceae bacterium]|nr:ParA family protein [Acetobacteraceae bacterium]
MPILTIASSKGGVGKTVVAEILVAQLAADGCRIAVLDADPNRALSGWLADVYEGPPPVEVIAEADETRVALAMPALSATADSLIIDTAGFASLAASVAMTGADAVLVPVLPGRADLVEAERTVQRAESLARAARREVPVRVVANRVRRGTSLSKHALSQAEDLRLPRLTTALSDLVGHGEIGFTGRLPGSSLALEEIAALVAELRQLGWIPEALVRAIV